MNQFYCKKSSCVYKTESVRMKRCDFFMQAEERVRKISSDLRREIVDLGGAENVIELRTKKKIMTAAPKDLMDVVVREALVK